MVIEEPNTVGVPCHDAKRLKHSDRLVVLALHSSEFGLAEHALLGIARRGLGSPLGILSAHFHDLRFEQLDHAVREV
jgi:hypothetical protein